ncbi:MAG: VCBS repeat-containing protein [bacterium]|nr:VCBS repeat-containing protein [bacterium]
MTRAVASAIYALRGNNGILLYKNLGTNTFATEDIKIPQIDNLGIHVVAFVDINNDGWQDIYVTSYGEGKNYFILNKKGKFQNPILLEVPNTRAIVTEAASFGDLNKDGYLDFVQGNWFFGSIRYLSSKKGAETNKLVINKGLQFIEGSLAEITGPTLSTLLSDFTNDNNLDLIVGNDHEEPDIFHIGNGEGA